MEKHFTTTNERWQHTLCSHSELVSVRAYWRCSQQLQSSFAKAFVGMLHRNIRREDSVTIMLDIDAVFRLVDA